MVNKDIQLKISQRFDIIKDILKKSTNHKYKVDMLNRIKRLYFDVFGEFDRYEAKQKALIKIHSVKIHSVKIQKKNKWVLEC